MPIVPQSAPNSNAGFPAKPLLMLPAPRIAGLLAARVESATPDDDEILGAPLLYANPRLCELSPAEYMRLTEATERLLDAAMAYMLDNTPERDLRTAEDYFHIIVGGNSFAPPMPPKAADAESEADRERWRNGFARRMEGYREQAKRDFNIMAETLGWVTRA